LRDEASSAATRFGDVIFSKTREGLWAKQRFSAKGKVLLVAAPPLDTAITGRLAREH